MSATATAAAWEHGDYRGARLVVLLALADVVNDAHDNELWMLHRNLARKARVDPKTAREAIDAFVADGWLEQLEAGRGGKAGRYRFVGPPAGSGPTPDLVGSHARSPEGSPSIGTKRELAGSATAGVSDEADRIVREWWESHDPRPLGSFVGCRNIVREALDRGHPAARVAVALRRCGNSVPSRPALARELDRHSTSEAPRARPEGYDQRAPEGGRSW